MIVNRNAIRPRLILALARARGWRVEPVDESAGSSPSILLGARWDQATPADRESFEKELARLEADPAKIEAILAEPDRPMTVSPLASLSFGMGPAEERGSGSEPSHPRYEVKGEHARGGMGRVMVVIDHDVGREVAMKELLPHLADRSVWDRERFLREARITGQLEHPNIVPVYEIGSGNDGAAYYTMKFVRGELMEKRLARIQTDGSLNPKQRLAERLKLLDAFIDVCNAVAYAHSRGVVNRDLKPANVMIGDFGETVVLDWGLARKLGQEEEPSPPGTPTAPGERQRSGDTTRLTMDGDVMGTPMYMSPEQAKGNIEQVDERSDVYSLGAMLYEIAAGHPPFREAPVHELLRDVINKVAPAADEVDPLVPPELAAIAEAALNKDRTQRLSSAKTLAEEIQAWRDGRPMTLYRHTLWEQLRRFVRNNRALATALVGALLILAAGVAVSLTYARIASDRAAAEHESREVAEIRTEEARLAGTKMQAALELAQGQRLAAYSLNLLEENTTAALLVAIESARRAPGAASTNALWTALSRLVERRRFMGHEHNVTAGNFSPDGRLLATAGADFTARIWDIETGALVHRLEGHKSGLTVAEWNEDGTRLLTVPGHPFDDKIRAFSSQGTVDVAPRIWDAKTGECLKVLRGHTGFLRGAKWAPGGKVVSFGDDSTIRLWDANGVASVFTAPSEVLGMEVSPDGNWIATFGDLMPRVWNTGTPAESRELAGHSIRVNSVSFSADSKFLVSCDHAGLVLRRELPSLKIVKELRTTAPDPKHPQGPRLTVRESWSVLHHPDGERVAIQDSLGLHIWTADLSREISSAPMPDLQLAAARLDPDWKRALSVTFTSLVAREVATGAELVWLRGHEYNVEFAHFSPDGRRVVSGGRDHSAIVWDAEPGACLPTFLWHTKNPGAQASPDGTLALARTSDGNISIHDNESGKVLRTLDFPGTLEDFAWHGDSRHFLAWSNPRTVLHVGAADRGWLFDADSGGPEVRLWHWSDNYAWLMPVSNDRSARVWELATGKGSAPFIGVHPGFDFVSVRGDGRCIGVVTPSEARVHIKEVPEQHEILLLVGHSGWTIDCAFAADGTLLTTAMDATIRAWDPSTGKHLRSGRWPLIQETYIKLSPAGDTLALEGGGTARFYRLNTLDEIAALPRSFSAPISFTADGRFTAARRSGAVVHLPIDALAFAEKVVPRSLTPLEQRGMTDSRAEADAYGQAYYQLHPRASTFLLRANRALSAGNWEEALRHAEAAAVLLPANPDPRFYAASAHAAHAAQLKDDDRARAEAIEAGMTALEAAAERGYRDVETLEQDEGLAPLRGHTRWAALVAAAKKPVWE